MLVISNSVIIPWHELQFQTMRAQGNGGQHVNKTDSAVWLRFDYRNSPSLTPLYKEGLDKLSDSRVHDGFIMIRVETHRSQDMNRKEAMSRLVELLKKRPGAPRPATPPSRPAAPSASGSMPRSARGDQIHPRQARGWSDLPNARGQENAIQFL
jgi:ribosome-associated protein